MADPVWEVLVYNLDGDVQGPLRAYKDLNCTVRLNGIPTLDVVVLDSDPLYSWLRENDAALALYRTFDPGTTGAVRDIIFNGGMISVDESGTSTGTTLKLGAVGPAWRLNKLVIEEDATEVGTQYGIGGGQDNVTLLGSQSREELLHALTQITRKSVASTSAVDDYAWYFKPQSTVGTAGGSISIGVVLRTLAWEAWLTIAGGVNGVDWVVDPIDNEQANLVLDPTATPGDETTWYQRALGQLRVSSAITATKNNAVFEFGTGKLNVEEFQRVKDWGTLATYVVSDDGGSSGRQSSAAAAHGGKWHDILHLAELGSSTLKNDIMSEHTSIRANPREVYTLTPTADAPRYLVDWELGDQVPLRAKRGAEALFDGYVRVHGVEIAVDENGKAVEKPITVWEPA